MHHNHHKIISYPYTHIYLADIIVVLSVGNAFFDNYTKTPKYIYLKAITDKGITICNVHCKIKLTILRQGTGLLGS